MKTPSILFVALMMIYVTYSQEKTSWEYDGFKGKVKSRTTQGFSVITDNGQTQKGEIIDVEWGFNNIFITYNENGYWTKYTSRKSDGTIIREEVVTYSYDNISALTTHYYNYGIYDHKRVFTTDSKGNIIQTRRYNAADSLVSVSIYVKDDNRNDIEILQYDASIGLTSKTVNKYDENNNCIESVRYNADGSLHAKTLFKYGISGKRTERAVYDSAGNLTSKIEYQYNEEGYWSEVNTYNSADNSNKKAVYEYKYDVKGNWIEQIEYVNDVAVKITERQFEYFE